MSPPSSLSLCLLRLLHLLLWQPILDALPPPIFLTPAEPPSLRQPPLPLAVVIHLHRYIPLLSHRTTPLPDASSTAIMPSLSSSSTKEQRLAIASSHRAQPRSLPPPIVFPPLSSSLSIRDPSLVPRDPNQPEPSRFKLAQAPPLPSSKLMTPFVLSLLATTAHRPKTSSSPIVYRSLPLSSSPSPTTILLYQCPPSSARRPISELRCRPSVPTLPPLATIPSATFDHRHPLPSSYCHHRAATMKPPV